MTSLMDGPNDKFFFQTGDEMSKRCKFVFVTWVGPSVSVMKKAKMSTDKALMKDIIQVRPKCQLLTNSQDSIKGPQSHTVECRNPKTFGFRTEQSHMVVKSIVFRTFWRCLKSKHDLLECSVPTRQDHFIYNFFSLCV